jgi:hypothetical protein
LSTSEQRDQLEWEARFARPAALCGFASAVLIVVALFLPALSVGASETPLDRVTALAESSGTFLLAAALQALGAAAVAVVLSYVYRATKARRPQLPAVALVLGIAGPLAVAGVTLVAQIERVAASRDYLAAGAPTDEGAEAALANFAPEVLVGFSLGGSLALAFALVLISLNAMRAGLFSRFLGILGIALGVLNVVPLLGPPFILQLVWTVALGFLFLGRWPGGRGPAWERVEAVPWPTAVERMEAQRRARDEAEGTGGEPEVVEGEAREAEEERPRPASRKRRRGSSAG